MGFPEQPKPKGFPVTNFMIQSANAHEQVKEAVAKLKADGFTQTGPDEFTKTVDRFEGVGAMTGRFASAAPAESNPPRAFPAMDNLIGGKLVKPDTIPVAGGFPLPVGKPIPHNPDEWPKARGFDATNPALAHDKPTYVVADPPPKAPNPYETPSHVYGENPSRFIGYQNTQNYIILSGPYTAAEVAANGDALYNAVWELFKSDVSLRIAFPADKLKRELMTMFVIDPSKKRKGAYGRIQTP